MAHFARLEGDLVTQVVVIANDDILDADGNEVEALGAALCEQLVGPGLWVQTSYSGKFRRRYAGLEPGTTYSAQHDAFILPQPYPSWTLDLDDENDWVPPVPMPTNEGYWYEWDEQGQAWIPHKIEEQIEPSAG